MKAIMACGKNGVYGKDGKLPFDNVNAEDAKRDMQNFVKQTNGAIVIMGRRTWEAPDMVKPLPNRINVVMTNGANSFQTLSAHDSIDEVWHSGFLQSNINRVQKIYPGRSVWAIGGISTIQAFVEDGLIEEFHLTIFDEDLDGDTKIDFEWLYRYFSVSKRVTTANKTQFLILTKKAFVDADET